MDSNTTFNSTITYPDDGTGGCPYCAPICPYCGRRLEPNHEYLPYCTEDYKITIWSGDTTWIQ